MTTRAAELPDVRTGTPVLRVRRGRAEGEGVTVETAARGAERFDDVVFATHSDITLALLGEDADPAEAEVLRAIPYNDNEVYLHTGGGCGEARMRGCRAVLGARAKKRPTVSCIRAVLGIP